MNLEKIPLNKLVFDPSNARKHSKKNLDAIVGSLKTFGQQKPIVVDSDNRVIAGNGTLTAAMELGWSEISAVRTKLKGAEAKAFALADNRTSELAEWDIDILNDQLFELKEVGFDIEDIGFSVKDIDVSGYNRRHRIEHDDTPDGLVASEKFSIAVILENSEDHEALFLELRDRGFKVKVI